MLMRIWAVLFTALIFSSPAWAQFATQTTDNVQKGVVITPNDTSLLPQWPTKAIYNGNSTACSITMTLLNDQTASTVYQNVQPGSWMPVAATKVWATGTTCANLVATY